MPRQSHLLELVAVKQHRPSTVDEQPALKALLLTDSERGAQLIDSRLEALLGHLPRGIGRLDVELGVRIQGHAGAARRFVLGHGYLSGMGTCLDASSC